MCVQIAEYEEVCRAVSCVVGAGQLILEESGENSLGYLRVLGLVGISKLERTQNGPQTTRPARVIHRSGSPVSCWDWLEAVTLCEWPLQTSNV